MYEVNYTLLIVTARSIWSQLKPRLGLIIAQWTPGPAFHPDLCGLFST